MTYDELEKRGDFDTQLTPPVCRRCTECEGREHHWMEYTGVDWDGEEELEEFPQFQCKHCGVYGDECSECDWSVPNDGEDVGHCMNCYDEGVVVRASASSQPSASRTSQPASQAPFWEPWLEVELVSISLACDYLAQLHDAKKENAALTAEVERLRQSWTELRDAMVDMDRDCEDDLFENPSEALACCIELMDSIVTIEPKDRPDA